MGVHHWKFPCVSQGKRCVTAKRTPRVLASLAFFREGGKFHARVSPPPRQDGQICPSTAVLQEDFASRMQRVRNDFAGLKLTRYVFRVLLLARKHSCWPTACRCWLIWHLAAGLYSMSLLRACAAKSKMALQELFTSVRSQQPRLWCGFRLLETA